MTEQEHPGTSEPPVMAWAPPPPPDAGEPGHWPPQFSIGAVLKDSFARYAADPVRIFAIGLVPAIAGLLGGLLIGSEPPTLATLGSYFVKAALFGLVAGALGLTGAAITFALLEGGPQGSLGTAVRWGLSRVGWLLATGILLVFAVGGVYLAIGIPFALIARYLGPLAFLLILVIVVVVIWVGMRLYPALVGAVVDRLDAGRAIRRSWAVTKPTGVWLRLLGCFLLLGLLIGSTSLLAAALTVLTALPVLATSIIGGLLLAFVSPLSSTLQYSAYRRLVAPAPPAALVSTAPTPTAAPIAPAGPDSGADGSVAPSGAFYTWTAASASTDPPPTAPVTFVAPTLGGRGRAFVAATIVLALAGVVSGPLALGSFVNRQLTLPGATVGRVPPGTVVFGAQAALGACAVFGSFTSMPASGSFTWVASFSKPTKATDRIRVVIKFNGTEAVNETETPGAFNCIGNGATESGLSPGLYDFTVLVNDAVSAHGTLVVRAVGSS